MVVSKIDKTVHYVERKTIDDEDKGVATALYEIEIGAKDVVIGLGKEKHTYAATKGITYFPIYLVADNKIKSKIGVYEMKTGDTLKYIDEDGDLDVEEIEPLLFSFVNAKFLERSGSSPDFYHKQPPKDDTNIDKVINKGGDSDKDSYKESNKDLDKASIDEDADDTRKVKISEKMEGGAKQHADLFEQQDATDLPPLLAEETQEEADAIEANYTSLKTHHWIQKFMENSNYGIISNECDASDSMYCAVRDAYVSMGQKTTLQRLRKWVSTHIEEDAYKTCLNKYLVYSSEVTDREKEMRDIKQALVVLKRRVETTQSKDEQKQVIETAEKQQETYRDAGIMKKIAKGHMDSLLVMKDIRSLDEFVEKAAEGRLSATEVGAIGIFEKELNIKFIIMDANAFKAGDTNAVCFLTTQITGTYVNPRPAHYIVLEHNAGKYQLVSYKGKRMFTFVELPYHMKTMIVNKCLEHNDGTFHLLADFRTFMRKLGIKQETFDYEEEIEGRDIFVFHGKSMDKPPGELAGEQVDPNRLTTYFVLERVPNWRRMLSDEHIEPFKVDGMRWSSVRHYLQGSKYKKQNPDFYKLFSLDSNSDISKDITKANQAGGKQGKLRPKNIKIDPDYYGDRAAEERMLALTAKFGQSEILRRILLATKESVLKCYRKGEPLLEDAQIMQVRQKL